MRSALALGLTLMTTMGCAKLQPKTTASADIDSVPKEASEAPRVARCSQTSEVEKLQIRETLIIQVVGDVVAGTYHYATGERNALTDTGFQNILGKIAASESKTDTSTVLKLKDATLTTYFDEDFAEAKELAEIRYDLKEKKVSYALSTDERATTISGCQFE